MDRGDQGGYSSSDFVRKLYKMLEDPSYESVVRWGNEGDSFVVLENEKFTKHILPKHFKHSNFASFVRQLNKYDFHKVRHNNEEGGQSIYGQGAWEFKHPDFKMNNKDALDNIKRKAPVPRKSNTGGNSGGGAATEELPPSQQVDLMNTQLVATQQQLQTLQERHQELLGHHSVLLQEVIGLQKTVVNHEHVIQNVMSFLHSVDAQRRRESRVVNPFQNLPNGQTAQDVPPEVEEDEPASPLQHASKLLNDVNADALFNTKSLEHMNERAGRMGSIVATTPPSSEAAFKNNTVPPRPSSRNAPPSASSSSSIQFSELAQMVYPVGHDQGIDPRYSEHVHNIPYPMPSKQPEPTDPRYATQQSAVPTEGSNKKKHPLDPGWARQPQILLVEDDPTCRRIGGKFLYAFNCSIDNALDGLEAVNKMNSGSKYDLILMDIVMPNLDGVSASHLIRQFDSTPIIAMTSNIRSDDISMYFSHGMSDVLPKPFTKEGLLAMLDKHLGHLKQGALMYDTSSIGAQGSSRHSVKDDESPRGSPATISTHWNSPAGMPGVSPVGSNLSATQDFASYPMDHAGMSYGTAPPTPMNVRAPQQAHRRNASEMAGGENPTGPQNVKRQQMYASHPQR